MLCGAPAHCKCIGIATLSWFPCLDLRSVLFLLEEIFGSQRVVGVTLPPESSKWCSGT